MLQEQIGLPIGTSIGGRSGEIYRVESLLGRGGFSAVYRVKEQIGQERIFALKDIIDPDPQRRRTLALEAEILMGLDHPSLPHVYQVFENVRLNRIFMLMDFIDGKNLENVRKEQAEQRFSLSRTIAIMTPIIDAVIYLHTRERPIVHRDIKPANIIVPTDASNAFLVDLGLAKEYVEDKTTGVLRYGSPGYAAPEQYVKGTNQRTDVYALGATLYTLLTGTIPEDALSRCVNEQGNDLFKPVSKICPAIPELVSKIIEQAMSLRIDSRFVTVEEFWRVFCIAAALPDHSVNQTSGEQANILNQMNNVIPLQVAKTPATPIFAQSIASPRYPRASRRIMLSLVALALLIIGSLSIGYRSIFPSVTGSQISPLPFVQGKRSVTTTLHNRSQTMVSSPVVNSPSVEASISGGPTNAATSVTLPTQKNVVTPVVHPTQTSIATSVAPSPQTNTATLVDCISGSPSTLTFVSPKKGENPSPDSLVLTNCGGHSGWIASLQTNDGGGWLSVSLSNGTIAPNGSENIQVLVQNASLAYGTYQGSIHFSQGAAFWSVSVVNIIQKK